MIKGELSSRPCRQDGGSGLHQEHNSRRGRGRHSCIVDDVGRWHDASNQLVALTCDYIRGLTETSQVGNTGRPSIGASAKAGLLGSSRRSALHEQSPVGELEPVQSLNCHLGDGVLDVFTESETLSRRENLSLQSARLLFVKLLVPLKVRSDRLLP